MELMGTHRTYGTNLPAPKKKRAPFPALHFGKRKSASAAQLFAAAGSAAGFAEAVFSAGAAFEVAASFSA